MQVQVLSGVLSSRGFEQFRLSGPLNHAKFDSWAGGRGTMIFAINVFRYFAVSGGYAGAIGLKYMNEHPKIYATLILGHHDI